MIPLFAVNFDVGASFLFEIWEPALGIGFDEYPGGASSWRVIDVELGGELGGCRGTRFRSIHDVEIFELMQ